MGIFLMELIDLTFSHILEGLAVLVIVAEVYKKIKEVKIASDADHERKQGWDNAAKVIKEKEKEWDSGLLNVDSTRKEIVKKYDDKFSELEEKMDKDNEELTKTIEENKIDSEAKMQELKIELFVQTECTRAILDGLHQLNCNGPVTKARELLDTYLSGSAHDIKDIEKLLKRGA